jgi:hypothetical protein
VKTGDGKRTATISKWGTVGCVRKARGEGSRVRNSGEERRDGSFRKEVLMLLYVMFKGPVFFSAHSLRAASCCAGEDS